MLSIAAGSLARAVEREDVPFAVTFQTVWGQSVYVLGDIPELGDGDPAYAVKLEPGSYPLWQAAVAIPTGTSFTYQYTWRDDSVPEWSDSLNHNPFGTVINDATSPADPKPAKKGLYYHSGWFAPVLEWRTGSSGAFTARSMQAFGPGRSPAERRWRAIGVGEGERLIEFFFTDAGSGRDPATGTYATKLDAFFVQDGQVYDYPPAPAVSPQRRDYNPASPPKINSVHLGEFRPYRVLLPRGYDEHPSKRYPVLYMHDGQNVFEMGPYGSWHADVSADDLTQNGVMREIIIVGVDNTVNRIWDYLPPDDTVPFGPGAGGPGRADDYAAFLINELKPVIDGTYRTYTDRDNTGAIGSSMGGVVSLYLGWDYNAAFARCGPMSGAWQFPNFPSRVKSEPYRDLRAYFDSGDCCATSYDNAWGTMSLRDNFLAKGYVLERNLKHVVGYGHQHNETAWEERLPFAYEFLFPATEAENPLRAEIFTGDLDEDGDMDLDDHVLFEACIGGPDLPPAGSCPAGIVSDLDNDGDTDLKDFQRLTIYFSG